VKQAFFDTFGAVTSVAYLLLAVNVLTMIATLPLSAVALATDLAHTWPALVMGFPLTAIACYAAFACFAEHSGGGLSVVRTFAAAWVDGLRQVGMYGVVGAAAAGILAVDIVGLAGTPLGWVAIPVLGTMAAVGLATLVVAIAAAGEFRSVRRVDLAKASLACAVRRGGWSLVSLAALGAWAATFAVRPALALTLVTGPVLYVVWSNSRHALQPLRLRLNPPRPTAPLSGLTAPSEGRERSIPTPRGVPR
jgi:hypothetical protein